MQQSRAEVPKLLEQIESPIDTETVARRIGDDIMFSKK
jgi:hypothetical protein